MIALALAVPATAAGEVTLEQVGTFAQPTYVTAPRGDTARIFVVEKAGTIRVVKDGSVLAKPFADLTARVTSTGERGLLSIAFAPDYDASGRLYAYFTNLDGDIEVDELRRSPADANLADPSYRRTVFTVAHRFAANHNGGQLQFGPDGLLYAGTGDGGGGGDPQGNAQNPASKLGKLLRIDPAKAGAQPEIVALGLRNPWRFSFDRWTGDRIIADVGQGQVEEVDFNGGDGANFGWNRFEGDQLYNPQTVIQGPVVDPVVTHRHSEGWCSITGGYVVRDVAVPELFRRYVYGDFCKGEIYAVSLPDGEPAPTGLKVPALSSFGEDGCGRVYAASLGGPVYRLTTRGLCVLVPSWASRGRSAIARSTH